MALIAHYPLNGNADDIVKGNHSEEVNNVSWVNGKIGKVGDFNPGSGNGVWMPYNEDLSRRVFSKSTVLSFSFWVNLRSYQSYGILVGNLNQSSGSYSSSTSAVWVNSSGIRFVLGIGEGGNPSGSTSHVSNAPTLNEWHHVVCSSDEEKMYIYVDGELASSKDIALTLERIENNDGLQIGTPRTYGDNEGIDGLIDDVRIFDHTLSTKEVIELAKAPVLSKLNGDGIENDSITVPDAPTITGPTTISFWFFPTNSSTRQTIWNNGYGGEGTINWETDNRIQFYSGPNGGNNSGYESILSSNLPLNQWHHVTFTRNNGDVRCYINGLLDSTRTFSFNEVGETTFDLEIGTGYTNQFQGKLKEVKQFATALSEDDVFSLYETGMVIDDGYNIHTNYIEEPNSSETPDTFSLERNKLKIGQISEVGIDRGISNWYPLNKNETNLVTNEQLTLQGTNCKPTAKGYDFDGTTDNYLSGTVTINPTNFTVSCFLMKRSHAIDSYPIFVSFGLPYIACSSSGSPFRISYTGDSQVNANGTTVPELNRFYHIVATFGEDGVRIYVDGILEGHNTTVCTNNGEISFDIGRHAGKNMYRIDGVVGNLKMFNAVLTEEEIAQEFNATRTQINNNTAFAKEFIEV